MYPHARLALTMMRYENGHLDQEATLALFQELVDTGLAWDLQGAYGRTALMFLEAGLIRPPQTQDAPRNETP